MMTRITRRSLHCAVLVTAAVALTSCGSGLPSEQAHYFEQTEQLLMFEPADLNQAAAMLRKHPHAPVSQAGLFLRLAGYALAHDDVAAARDLAVDADRLLHMDASNLAVEERLNAQVLLSECEMATKNYSAALELSRQAAESNAPHSDVIAQRYVMNAKLIQAQCLDQLNRRADAEQLLKTCLRDEQAHFFYPDLDVEFKKLLFKITLNSASLQDAENIRVAAAHKKWKVLKAAVDRLCLAHDWAAADKACAGVEQFTKNTYPSGYPEILMRHAFCMEKLSKQDQCDSLLQLAAEAAHDMHYLKAEAQAYREYGRKLLWRKEYDRAIPVLKKWAAIEPDNADAQAHVVYAERAAGKFDEASSWITQWEKRSSNKQRFVPLTLQALVLVDKGQQAQADAMLQRAADYSDTESPMTTLELLGFFWRYSHKNNQTAQQQLLSRQISALKAITASGES